MSHGIWLLRTRRIRKRASEAQMSFDDFPEAVEWQSNGLKLNTALGIETLLSSVRPQSHDSDKASCQTVVEQH